MPNNLYRRNGVWWARVQVDGADRRCSLRTRDKLEARRKLAAVLATTRQQRGDRVSWKVAVTRWSADAGGGVKPNVLKRYKVSLRAVRDVLDPLLLDEISRRTMAEIATRRRKMGASNATIRRDLTAVSSVLRFAVAQEWIDTNAAHEWDRSIIRERRDPIALPDPADIDAVVAAAPGNFARLIRFAQYTGMRQEEIASLERPQVRLEAGAVDLWQSKTDRPRVVPLDVRAAGTLAGTPAHLVKRWVFWHGQDGARYRNVASRFAAIVRQVATKNPDFRRFRFHDLRHWYAVDYLRRHGGTAIYDLQKNLGHASIKTTEIYLAYLTPGERSAQKPAQI